MKKFLSGIKHVKRNPRNPYFILKQWFLSYGLLLMSLNDHLLDKLTTFLYFSLHVEFASFISVQTTHRSAFLAFQGTDLGQVTEDLWQFCNWWQGCKYLYFVVYRQNDWNILIKIQPQKRSLYYETNCSLWHLQYTRLLYSWDAPIDSPTPS